MVHRFRRLIGWDTEKYRFLRRGEAGNLCHRVYPVEAFQEWGGEAGGPLSFP